MAAVDDGMIITEQGWGESLWNLPKDYFSREHMQEDFPSFVFFFVLWSMFYLILRHYLIKDKLTINGKKQTQDEWLLLINSIPSATHGLCAFTYGLYHYMNYSLPECGMLNTNLQRLCLAISISYFVYDSVCMVLEKTIDKFVVIHHFFSICGLFIPYIENRNGIYSMIGLFVTEVSNPSMYMKNFLKMFGMRHTRIYEVAEVVFLTSYFIGRAILSWSYVYHSVTCQSNHWIFKLTCFGLFFQSLNMLYKMRLNWYRRFDEIMRRKKLGIHLHWLHPLSKTEIEKLQTSLIQVADVL